MVARVSPTIDLIGVDGVGLARPFCPALGRGNPPAGIRGNGIEGGGVNPQGGSVILERVDITTGIGESGVFRILGKCEVHL